MRRSIVGMSLLMSFILALSGSAIAQQRTSDEFMGDTLRGAAGGAAIGAIAGNAGKGAAAGAVGGILLGGMRRRR